MRSYEKLLTKPHWIIALSSDKNTESLLKQPRRKNLLCFETLLYWHGGGLVLALPLNIFDHIPGKGLRTRSKIYRCDSDKTAMVAHDLVTSKCQIKVNYKLTNR